MCYYWGNERMELMMKDYGSPKLSDDFFDENPFKEISAARLLYSTMLSPGVEKLALEFSKVFVSRGKKEAKRIRREKNPDNLLEMMKQHPDSINHWLLKKKIIGYSKLMVPKIIEELEDNEDDVFVELAVKIIYGSKIDCSSQLLEILDSIEHPYTLSLLCLLLGFNGPEESIQPVWNCYHFLKEKYPKESYDQGPLLALYEFKERFDVS